MKTKISALSLVLYIILYVFLAVYFTACPGWGELPPNEVHINSLSDAEKKLAEFSYPGVGTPNYPVWVFVNFDLGDLSRPDNNYLRLLEIIEDSGLYVDLTLQNRMLEKNVFTSPPLSEAVKGMDKVVNISLHGIATSIMADSNEKSPFYFYENLVRVIGRGDNFTHIDNFAFSSCKSLERVDFYGVKTVGREAFNGCENLKRVDFPTALETIGDKAFYDCSALERLSIRGKYPKLGDSVFLGSTPSRFIFNINKEYEGGFRRWINENASSFNNDGADIDFER